MFSCPVWEKIFQQERAKKYMDDLVAFIKSERATKEIFPPADKVFAALHATPYAKVTTLILGQDPYHTSGVADGLAFSSAKEGYCPPSLEVVIREIVKNMKMFNTKIDFDPVKEWKDFSLKRWAEEEGVLLLNPVLTVEKGKAGSHCDKGWETFTREIIKTIAMKPEPIVVMLWGKEAQKYAELFNRKHVICDHLILKAPHPAAELYNPKAGFTGSNHFHKERIFRLDLQAKKKSSQWPVTWLNFPKKSL